MRIKYRLKKICSNKVMDCLKLSSVYGYSIYRAVALNLLDDDEKVKCCNSLINISNEFTKYLTMEDNEEELYETMNQSVRELNIDKDCDDLIINKFKDSRIKTETF